MPPPPPPLRLAPEMVTGWRREAGGGGAATHPVVRTARRLCTLDRPSAPPDRLCTPEHGSSPWPRNALVACRTQLDCPTHASRTTFVAASTLVQDSL